MAKTRKRQIGDVGEGVACRFLKREGFKVLERNYWKPWGEIDIVVKKGQNLRFIEFKTARFSVPPEKRRVSRETIDMEVSWETGIRPEENMHPAKVGRLHRAIQSYLVERKVPESIIWQLDLVCVYLDTDSKRARVEVINNVIL